MADPSGTLVKAAVRRPGETTDWGDGCTRSDVSLMIPLLNESLTETVIHDYEEAIEGRSGRSGSDLVGIDVQGSFSTELQYNNLDPLWFAALGFECPSVISSGTVSGGNVDGGSPAPWDTAGNGNEAYQHLYEPDDVLAREAWTIITERAVASGTGLTTDADDWAAGDQKVRSFDFLINKQVGASNIWVFKDCMIRSFTLKAGLDGVSVDWDVVAHSLAFDSEANCNYSSWDYAGPETRAVFPHLDVKLGTAGASESSSFAVQEITMKFENPIESQRASGSDSEYILEPIRNGMRKITGSIKLARFTSTTPLSWNVTDTDLQLAIDFTGTTAISNDDYPQYRFLLPWIKLTKADFVTNGAGVITGDLEYEAFEPTARPTWITTQAGGQDFIKDREMYLFNTNSLNWCFARDRHDGNTLP
jgi:hypothetical protein